MVQLMVGLLHVCEDFCVASPSGLPTLVVLL